MSVTADPYLPHDHRHCQRQALDEARTLCSQQGTRLTPIRETVLELVWQSHRPLGAYDILAELNREGGRTAPPTVYRALEFLQGMGLVHRIASLNAYIGCPHPARRHQGCFLICRSCRRVRELALPPLSGARDEAAREEGFSVEEVTLEATGLCPSCHEADPA